MKTVLEDEMTVADAAPHIDRCLGCLACVSHCPSGVAYGDLISSYRDHVNEQQQRLEPWTHRLRDLMARMTLPYASRFRWAVRMGKLSKPFSRWMPSALQPMLELLPKDLPPREDLPEFTAAVGTKRGRLALLAGCAQQVLAPDINQSAIRVLSRNGYDVLVPKGQGCCGALSWHVGRGKEAGRFAKKLIALVPDDVDYFVTTAAGCGSAIHEYPLVLAGTSSEGLARQVAAKSIDISVLLAKHPLVPIRPLSRPMRIAYHDACHLAHAQGVRSEPRQLLDQIGGLQIADVADADTCCGSAGTYNIEQPEIAEKLGKRKAERLLETGASAVVTGNIGCLVQLEKHLGFRNVAVPVFHTVQILDRAYQEILS